MAKMNKLTAFALAGTLLVATQPSIAAIEIQEDEFGPSYETTMVDAVAGKPLQLMAALAGTTAYVVSYPFSYFSGSKEQAKETLVTKPWEAMDRCLGCTPAENKYIKSQRPIENGYRLVVDGPSEIIIETDDRVVVDGNATMSPTH